MQTTFPHYNVIPQFSILNLGAWAQLENNIRVLVSLPQFSDKVLVQAGSLFYFCLYFIDIVFFNLKVIKVSVVRILATGDDIGKPGWHANSEKSKGSSAPASWILGSAHVLNQIVSDPPNISFSVEHSQTEEMRKEEQKR